MRYRFLGRRRSANWGQTSRSRTYVHKRVYVPSPCREGLLGIYDAKLADVAPQAPGSISVEPSVNYNELECVQWGSSSLYTITDFPSGRDVVSKYLGDTPIFVFDDEQESRGIIRLASASTASYTVILDNKGDCQFGIGDLKIHDRLTVDKVNRK